MAVSVDPGRVRTFAVVAIEIELHGDARRNPCGARWLVWTVSQSAAQWSQCARSAAAVNRERKSVSARVCELEPKIRCERLHVHQCVEESAARFVWAGIGQAQSSAVNGCATRKSHSGRAESVRKVQ